RSAAGGQHTVQVPGTRRVELGAGGDEADVRVACRVEEGRGQDLAVPGAAAAGVAAGVGHRGDAGFGAGLGELDRPGPQGEAPVHRTQAELVFGGEGDDGPGRVD